MAPLSNIATRAVETLIHPYTNLAAFREMGPVVIERGKGVWLYSTDGKAYLEGMAGLWCTSLGYGNEELVEAAAAQMRKVAYTHLYTGKSHDAAIELAERLKEMAPVPISKVFFCNSGSEANDTQIKLIWYMNNALGRPKKKKIVSRQKAFHGVGIGSGSLSGLSANHVDFDLPIAGIVHASAPHYYRLARDGESEEDFATRLAQELEEIIIKEGPDTVAAFIAEPLMGAGGVIPPPRTYFEKIMAVCDKYDLYVISDEVICGFGRLGTMFGCEKFNFRPHGMSVAKALSSAYLPIAGVLISEAMYQTMLTESTKLGTFGHGFTYSGHPVAAAVANKTLEIYKRDRILDQIGARIPRFEARVKKLADHPIIGDARSVGLVAGFELAADKKTKRQFDPKKAVGARAVKFAEEEGLIVRPLAGDIVAVCPPFVISMQEIDELFDRLDRAFDKTLDWAKREQLLSA